MAQGSQFAGSSAAPVPCQPSLASVGDYVTLMKPRVMSLVVFTALVSVMIAPGHIHPVIGFTALLCIAVGAGAAGALNMWYDADIDALMSRTSSRPIPRGRMAAGEALALAFPCSQSLPAQRKRGGRFCVIPSCSCRSARPHGF